MVLKHGLEDVHPKRTRKALKRIKHSVSHAPRDALVLCLYHTHEYVWGHHCFSQPFDLALENQFREQLEHKKFQKFKSEWEMATKVSLAPPHL